MKEAAAHKERMGELRNEMARLEEKQVVQRGACLEEAEQEWSAGTVQMAWRGWAARREAEQRRREAEREEAQ